MDNRGMPDRLWIGWTDDTKSRTELEQYREWQGVENLEWFKTQVQTTCEYTRSDLLRAVVDSRGVILASLEIYRRKMNMVASGDDTLDVDAANETLDKIRAATRAVEGLGV